LGLEALSRGAAQVTFVERDGVAVRELRARLTEWGGVGGQVEHMDAERFLNSPAQPFEIVFLDPPFASGLLPKVAALLEDAHWLSAAALIYVETDADRGLPALPTAWKVMRTKQAGAVGYHLLTRGDA
jgi:16S rRNA (guanine966-N2)-methyltransferase